MKKQIIVVGLGLIGGSLALSLQKLKNVNIIGIDQNDETRKLAVEKQLVSKAYRTIEEVAQVADIIIFATPVETTCNELEKLASLSLKETCIISDVGSTKQLIMEKAKSLPAIASKFIGGHPMAGSHKSGIVAAKERLFENAYYIITPSEENKREDVEALIEVIDSTNAKIIEMTAKEHDQYTALVSHFPHLIASSLVYLLENEGDEAGVCKNLAAGGFRDITRIASSNSVMWRDVVLHNASNLTNLLDRWIGQMSGLKERLQVGSKDELQSFFQDAKEIRDDLPKRRAGAIPSFYDLFVDVPDHPGSIANVATIIAKEEISIVNIEILEVREDIFGVLRISFQTEEDREKGQLIIERNGYSTQIK